jgi:hypothetical protein
MHPCAHLFRGGEKIFIPTQSASVTDPGHVGIGRASALSMYPRAAPEQLRGTRLHGRPSHRRHRYPHALHVAASQSERISNPLPVALRSQLPFLRRIVAALCVADRFQPARRLFEHSRSNRHSGEYFRLCSRACQASTQQYQGGSVGSR